MNCLAHAFQYLHDPHFVVGACLPDWLGAVDRKVRIRQSDLERFQPTSNLEPDVHSIVKGVAQHLHDDALFHNSNSFLTTSSQVTKLIPVGDDETGHRRAFVGHVLTEMLLDASIEEELPGTMERYYQAVAAVSPDLIEHTVNNIARRTTDRLTRFVNCYVAERYLLEYLTDEGMLRRLNGLLGRVKLRPFPMTTISAIRESRQIVSANREGLLHPIKVS